VVGNTFKRITAENVDVKEETRGTLIAGNRFDGSAISGENFADSVVDVKGYGGTVTGNLTTGNAPALKNIIETHVITEPETSGCGNRIENNRVEGFRPAGALVAVDKKCG
jgi:Na+-translocating ferredoxin:NAD+ oxidoreductase RnfG subunit